MTGKLTLEASIGLIPKVELEVYPISDSIAEVELSAGFRAAIEASSSRDRYPKVRADIVGEALLEVEAEFLDLDIIERVYTETLLEDPVYRTLR